MLKIQKNSIIAKVFILRDFQIVYAFDADDAEFPEPVGHFTDDRRDAIL